MPELPAPAAARLPRPRWLDARLAAGLFLVLGSVVLGAKVVAEADDTVPVWALARDVAPTELLEPDDLRRVDVRLDDSLGRYVAAEGSGPVGYVVLRDLEEGELLPAAAVARDDAVEHRRVVVDVPGAAAEGLTEGSVVDVYVVPTATPGEEQPPARLVLEGATVVEDPAVDGRFGARLGTGVALHVPATTVRGLLSELATGTAQLVEVPRGARGGVSADGDDSQQAHGSDG